ncbi:MAG: hypothetical protein ACE5R6_15790 [Candidatus Heimdallarchaeota archaeon]
MPIYYEPDDAIKGKRIACQFRKSGKTRVISGSSRHRAQKVTLYDAYCVIVTPIKKA